MQLHFRHSIRRGRKRKLLLRHRSLQLYEMIWRTHYVFLAWIQISLVQSFTLRKMMRRNFYIKCFKESKHAQFLYNVYNFLKSNFLAIQFWKLITVAEGNKKFKRVCECKQTPRRPIASLPCTLRPWRDCTSENAAGVQVISWRLTMICIFASLMWSRDRATQGGSKQIRILRETASRLAYLGRLRAD